MEIIFWGLFYFLPPPLLTLTFLLLTILFCFNRNVSFILYALVLFF